MKVLLCNINSKYIHSSLSIWYLYESLKASLPEIEIYIYESTVNAPIEEVINSIKSFNAEYICFSCYIWNISYIKNIIRAMENECNFILGGPEATHSAKELLEFSGSIKYIVMGEGEDILPAILKGNLNNGVSYRKNGDIIIGNIAKCSAPPNPYSREYLSSLKGRIAYIEASRGCPFSCSFCLSGRKDNVRFFDLDETKKKIITLANSETKTVKFIDRTFNCNPERAAEIISFILSEYKKGIPEGVCFHFEVAADLFNESLLKLLSEAPVGLFQIEAGIQSFNEKTLTACTRKTNIKKIERNLRFLLKRKNMHIHIDLIAGLPHEDIKSFENSFDKAYELKANMLQLGFLKFLKGSEIRKTADEFGAEYSDSPPYEITSNNILSSEDIEKLKGIEEHLEKMYNSGRFLRTLNYLLKSLELTPFKLFSFITENIEMKNNMSLTEYTDKIYNLLSEKTDKEKLRDIMICDFLSTNASGHLPSSLYRYDKRLSKVRAGIKGRKGNAVLYSGTERAVIADYEANPHPITGRYKLQFITL